MRPSTFGWTNARNPTPTAACGRARAASNEPKTCPAATKGSTLQSAVTPKMWVWNSRMRCSSSSVHACVSMNRSRVNPRMSSAPPSELGHDPARLGPGAQEGRRARQALHHRHRDVEAKPALGVVAAATVVVAEVEALRGERGSPHPGCVREGAPCERQARYADGLDEQALESKRDAEVEAFGEVHPPAHR